ncbi:hypothetical protein JTE90_020258, partial [Oedothorax gibbosus]
KDIASIPEKQGGRDGLAAYSAARKKVVGPRHEKVEKEKHTAGKRRASGQQKRHWPGDQEAPERKRGPWPAKGTARDHEKLTSGK